MQQREPGATIFHLQVAPLRDFSEKTLFMRHFGANSRFYITKRTKAALSSRCAGTIGRVAPSLSKNRVAPGCTRIVLQANLASS
ncbi:MULTISPECIES: hypothetical protein [Pseudomonas]|uniref:Uncharacterized protein n=1 Tax=Pseudomonas farsensis TaxID=2745492 RepID=A0ABU8QY91_9PSED|nr:MULTISPECIES: hypothetical protein [Pseudomonas]MBC3412289.1 hypothetical protein [Pseudomonas sp. SWRI51]MBV4531709.1 hypothetical protein [Pseudomonas farsensis]